jgi:hypothetical protein
MTGRSSVGSPETLRRRLAVIARETGADDLILATQAYDHAARLRSFEIAASCFERSIGQAGPAVDPPNPLTQSGRYLGAAAGRIPLL